MFGKSLYIMFSMFNAHVYIVTAGSAIVEVLKK
jgi:hypothetical protein